MRAYFQKYLPNGNAYRYFFAHWATKLGDALSNPKVVLPWLLAQAGAPTFFSGLLVPIRESGSLIPQVVFGRWMTRFALRKRVFSAGCVIQALALLAIVLAAWCLSFEGLTAVAFGCVVLAALCVFSLARALCSISSKDVLGKITKKSQRGKVSGLSASAAGLVVCAVALGLLVVPKATLSNSAMILVAIAVICFAGAAMIFYFIEEHPSEKSGDEDKSPSAITLFKQDDVFRRFVLVRACMMSSGLSAPFIVLLANQTSNSPLALGLFIGLSGLASLISGNLWGEWADHNSAAVIKVLACIVGGICLSLAFLAWMGWLSWWLCAAYFFALSIVHEGVRVGRKTYVVDMAEGDKRTQYVSVSNTAIGILLLCAGLIGAAIAQFSVALLLGVYGGMALAGAVLALKLPDVQSDHE